MKAELSLAPTPIRLAAALLISAGSSFAVSSPEVASFQSFFKEHCTRCHGPEKQKGDFRVDDLTGNFAAEGTRWAVIRDQILDGEMPPKKEKQPTATQRKAITGWISGKLAGHAAKKPNHGNLVPHELLFGPLQSATTARAAAPAPRLWRLSPDGYLGFVSEISKGAAKNVVQPFSTGAERGIKDFAALGMVDEPSAEILVRNADTIVAAQTGHEIVDGKVKGKNDSIREYTELMAPGLVPTREQIEKAIQKQFKIVLARAANPDEVERFHAFYEKCAQGGDYHGAVKTMLTAVILRAEAIFRQELGGENGMLTPREVAAAISSALMHRRENGLFDAAEKGRLDTREEIAVEVRRILDNPKLQKPRLLGFFREYFEYGNATEVFKDRPKDLMHEPRQHVADTDRLVQYILDSDRDVLKQLLTTPLAFVNVKTKTNKETRQEEYAPSVEHNKQNNKGQATIETLYGFEQWPIQQPVTLAPDTRLGILMQPSWLLAWSENFNNDIVRRGKFIRERLLGGTVPDLPIGVAAMVPNEPHRPLRERVESVTRAEACWKCHQRMDDLGLPFEAFDHYSRLRKEEQVLDPEATAQNVDKKGKPLGEVYKNVPLLTTGLIAGSGDPKLDGPVSGPHELMRKLAESDRVRQVFIRHVFRYYLGRNESAADARTLQQADRAYVESGGSFKALLVSLFTSDSFLTRSRQGLSQNTKTQ
jgi:hypothetical protein